MCMYVCMCACMCVYVYISGVQRRYKPPKAAESAIRDGISSQIKDSKIQDLMRTKRGKPRLILILSANTNCEYMAYLSYRFESVQTEVSDKLPQE